MIEIKPSKKKTLINPYHLTDTELSESRKLLYTYIKELGSLLDGSSEEYCIRANEDIITLYNIQMALDFYERNKPNDSLIIEARLDYTE